MLTRDDAIARLRASADTFLAHLARYDDEAWQQAPAGGGWSPRETVEHCILVESGVLRLLQAAMDTPPGAPPARPLTDEELWDRLTSRQRRVDAPERVRPQGAWPDREAALAEFARRREATIHYAATCAGPLRERWIRITVGEIDGLQTFLMLAGHLLRHLDQIRESTPPSAQSQSAPRS